MFYFDEIDGRKILRSDLIKNAQAFFTTREICICNKTAPTPAPSLIRKGEILENKELIADYLKIEQKNLISPIQTHSVNVRTLVENQFEYYDTDGLILTNKTNAIFLNFADCTPLIFYDVKQNIGAVSHAGWRGTAGMIAKITAQKLIKECHSNPDDICVLIGPAIGQCCYNVGEEVFEKLKSTVEDFEGLYRKDSDSVYVDLKNINRKQLTEIGIKKIDICPYCTCCYNKYFYSYRKENGTTYRHSAVLKLA